MPAPRVPTDLYFVLGNPVEHSRSPWIHSRFAELTGQALRYEKHQVPIDGFAAGFAVLRARHGALRGCNITVPFKFEAARLADATSERARLAGAVNTLAFDDDGIHADNTDGVGLVNDITQNAGRAIAGQQVLLIGAGGAGAGVLGPLLAARPSRLVLVNRTESRAQALAARHAELAARHGVSLSVQPINAVSGQFDIVINATASSLGGSDAPVEASVLKRGTLACDVMYGPAAAPFLQWATAHGAEARDGLGMLVEQAAESFHIWRGVTAPARDVLAELRATL